LNPEQPAERSEIARKAAAKSDGRLLSTASIDAARLMTDFIDAQ
jgi:hypothetical protein